MLAYQYSDLVVDLEPSRSGPIWTHYEWVLFFRNSHLFKVESDAMNKRT